MPPAMALEYVNVPNIVNLLSFNMMAGARVDRAAHYLTKSWQHVLPGADKHRTLSEIAKLIQPFDVVCLQEVDGGSARSGFVHQGERLQATAGFPFFADQRNRRVGHAALPFSCSGNAILSRSALAHTQNIVLPGNIRGRGALLMRTHQATIVNVHLSLTQSAQIRQLNYLAELLAPLNPPVLIVTGDFNCAPASAAVADFCAALTLHVAPTAASFPSWRPVRHIDLILYRGCELVSCLTGRSLASDHLPVSAQFALPWQTSFEET
jgi:endonuclease/exonuclease/phosphatase family metal-dependent hydrolase